MIEPRERQADAAEDPGLEVRPEVVKDLDVTGDDAEDIAGGCSWTRTTTYCDPQ